MAINKTARVLGLVCIAPLGGSCNDAGDDAGSGGDRAGYYENVAPILAEHCHQCHRDGGAGPFTLETYEQVKPLGSLIAHVTEERIMPPFLADNSGSCRTYRDANWLSEEDIATIATWVDDGKPEGDPAAMPAFDDKPIALEDATHTLEIEAPYVPNTLQDDDDYHCFIIDPEIDTTKFLTAYEVVPGDPKIVHHVIVYNPDDDTAIQEAYDLEAAEGGAGYTCYGGPIVDATVAAAWAPGRLMWEYPEGTGVPIEPGVPQILQVHYHVEEGLPPDQSSVKLRLEDSVEQELLPWFFANTELVLPPGKEDTQANLEITLDAFMTEGLERPELSTGMNLLGLGPHMHTLGKSEHVEVTKGDGSETSCLIDVPRWDFDWQYAYFFDNPVRIEPNDVLRLNCTYDTTDSNKVVEWGDGTDDEMCLALMYSTFDGGKIPK